MVEIQSVNRVFHWMTNADFYAILEQRRDVMSFVDLSKMEQEDAYALFEKRYPHLQFIGKSHGAIQTIRHLYKNTKANPDKLCPIEGIWGGEQLLRVGITPRILLVCPEYIHTAQAQQLIDELQKKAESFYAVSKKVFDTVREDASAGGILCVFPMKIHTLDEITPKKNFRMIVLDGIEIQGNAGTILRSADATAFDAVAFTHRKIRLNHPKLVRASMGSVLHVPIVDAPVEELIPWLEKHGIRIVLADTDHAVDYAEYDYPEKTCLVVGSEKYGIYKPWYEVPHDTIAIPMKGTVDSLNVAIAATVLMYQSII